MGSFIEIVGLLDRGGGCIAKSSSASGSGSGSCSGSEVSGPSVYSAGGFTRAGGADAAIDMPGVLVEVVIVMEPDSEGITANMVD